MGQGIGIKIAIIDGQTRHGVLPARDNRRAQFTGDRLGAKGAGVQVQELHGVGFLVPGSGAAAWEVP